MRATYLKYNRLYFEGKRPSSRETPNPVQVTLTGESKPSHDGKVDFLDNRLDVLSRFWLRGRAVIPNKDFSILPGQFGHIQLIRNTPCRRCSLPGARNHHRPPPPSFLLGTSQAAEYPVEARPVILGPSTTDYT